jgi:O-antigen/teichoic acid export membrane protein
MSVKQAVSSAPRWLEKARSFWPTLRSAYGQATPPAFLNVVSSGVRAATRAGWSLFVPYLLSVNAYGLYSVFQTTVIAVTQAGVLGSPQTILREPTRELPMAGLFLHSLSLAAAVLFILSFSVADYHWPFQVLVAGGAVAMILYLQLSMRAKSRFQFARVLRSEALGSVVFCSAILLISIAASRWGRGWIDYRIVGGVEILATGAILVSLLSGKEGRLSKFERGVRETRQHLASVYSVGVVVLFDVIIFRRLEVYFLEKSPSGLEGVAVFGLSAQIFTMFLLVPGAMIEAWGPSFARSHFTGRSEFLKTVRGKLVNYRKLYALIVLASISTPPLLIKIIFHKYDAWMWQITAFVAIRIVCSYASFHSATLYASRRERLLYGPVALGALVAITGNILLTLRWGVSGAIVAYGITQLTVASGTILMARYSRRVA